MDSLCKGSGEDSRETKTGRDKVGNFNGGGQSALRI